MRRKTNKVFTQQRTIEIIANSSIFCFTWTMNFLRSTIVIVTVLFAFHQCQASGRTTKISHEFQESVKHLLNLIGFENEYVRFLSYMKIAPPENHPEIKELYDGLFSSDAYRDDLIEVYEKFFTLEELKELIEFYSSPLGRKAIRFNATFHKQMENVMLNKISDYIFTAAERGFQVDFSPFPE